MMKLRTLTTTALALGVLSLPAYADNNADNMTEEPSTISKIADGVSDTASNAYEATKDATVDAYDATKEGVTGAYSYVEETIVDATTVDESEVEKVYLTLDFEVYDQNNDDVVDAAEFAKQTEAAAPAMTFVEFDTDNDGALNIEEFKEFANSEPVIEADIENVLDDNS